MGETLHYTGHQPSEMPTNPNEVLKDRLMYGAQRWGSGFERQSSSLMNQLSAGASGEEQAPASELLDLMNNAGDNALEELEELAGLGIDMRDAWGDSLVARAVSGQPFLIHAVTGNAGALKGIVAGRAITDVMRSCNFTSGRQVIAVDDTGRDPIISTARAENFLKDEGVLPMFGAVRGEDYIINRDSKLSGRVDLLGEVLRAGMVVQEDDGSICFRFLNDFPEMNAHSEEQRDRVVSEGVLLRDKDGSSTLTGRIVVALSDPESVKNMHLFLADIKDRQQYEDARLLLTTIDRDFHRLFRTIYIDHERLSPELAAYAICKRQELDAKKLLLMLDRFSAQPNMQTDEAKTYLEEEYSNPQPFDIQALRWLIPKLHDIFPKGIERGVRADGYGPYTFLAHALAPFMRNNKLITADISVANLSIALRIKEDTERSMAEHQAGLAFEAEMVKIGGDVYRFSYDHLLNLMEVEHGDMMNSPRSSCQVNVDGFVSYAVCMTKDEFVQFTQARARTVVPSGFMISAYFTGKKNWRRFPAAPVYVDDIRTAHAAAGMTITDMLVIPPVEGGSEEHGGETVIVIAQNKMPIRSINASGIIARELRASSQKFTKF